MAGTARNLAKDGTRRGGARPGAGRKRKESRSPTALTPVEIAAALEAPPPDEIESLLNGQALRSLRALVDEVKHGLSDSARIAAAVEILDRGYGKPTVEIGGDAAMPMLPLMMAPESSITIAATSAVRDEAKRYASLAVKVLQVIAERSPSESARGAAHRALIKREVGTVGVARMPDEQRDRPLGKKEEAARAAAVAASGLYAPRPAPRKFQ